MILENSAPHGQTTDMKANYIVYYKERRIPWRKTCDEEQVKNKVTTFSFKHHDKGRTITSKL